MTAAPLPVAIIGTGPAGLAAAVHLLDRGETALVPEAGVHGRREHPAVGPRPTVLSLALRRGSGVRGAPGRGGLDRSAGGRVAHRA